VILCIVHWCTDLNYAVVVYDFVHCAREIEGALYKADGQRPQLGLAHGRLIIQAMTLTWTVAFAGLVLFHVIHL